MLSLLGYFVRNSVYQLFQMLSWHRPVSFFALFHFNPGCHC